MCGVVLSPSWDQDYVWWCAASSEQLLTHVPTDSLIPSLAFKTVSDQKFLQSKLELRPGTKLTEYIVVSVTLPYHTIVRTHVHEVLMLQRVMRIELSWKCCT